MRIAVAQLNYKLGDFAGNFAKIANAIQTHHDYDLVVFSELCLSGYYPGDLIDYPQFLETQNHFLEKVSALTQNGPAVIIGFISKNPNKGKPFYNSLALFANHQQRTIYHKRLLPVYNIFDEARHFAPGKTPGIVEFNQLKIGLLICEDGWASLNDYLYDCDPVQDLMQHPLDLIICINGSPSNVGKQKERLTQFSSIAKRCQAPLIFTNQVGANDDIVFDGASFILDNEGKSLGALPSFSECVGTFSFNEGTIHSLNHFQQTSLVPEIALCYQQIILGLQDYAQKCGFHQVVLGVSGGLDSAITLALAVKALGARNVIGLAMPSRYSSKASLDDAMALCHTFNVQLFVASIEDEFSLALNQFTKIYGEKPKSLTEQNIQARLRGRFLMEYSNQTGALVLSTGNKSELSVGYTTLYGDMTGGLNLIGDLYKTEVYDLCEYFNQLHPDTPIPVNIIRKAPSAELAPEQKDSDNMPEYAILDPILKLYIEGDLLPKEEYSRYQTITAKLDPAIIKRVRNMVDKAEFKRRQAAPIIRLQRRAFGFGRQLPITGTFP
ncbi:NAD+ synthase [Candidatus Berkiella aquae]|uniref:Glutamine-dependent NAD(+) synthetase n=1 Tax=Candidatus Berkiella aquae TaxID=295108 RepID=A0A0Q9YX76_9GAMM|nr:NAD+ synthase [Candidatus Berkiella aquae]MCS5712461.1 NAD+ synthase [Candidatus Berkiella aquae]